MRAQGALPGPGGAIVPVLGRHHLPPFAGDVGRRALAVPILHLRGPVGGPVPPVAAAVLGVGVSISSISFYTTPQHNPPAAPKQKIERRERAQVKLFICMS